MTGPQKSNPETLAECRTSLLPFNPADLMAMRVQPAAFARMVGVSKQSVSQWIKEGKVTLGPDGLLDPVVASRQVIANTDPARLRARVFKQAIATYQELRDRIRTLEAEIETWRESADAQERVAKYRLHADGIARRLSLLLVAVESRFSEAVAAHGADELGSWLDELVAVEFYGQDRDEYRRLMFENDDDLERGAPTTLRVEPSSATATTSREIE